MRLVVSASGSDLAAPVSTVFGRCPTYVFVDTDTEQFEVVENSMGSAQHGAGISAAEFVIRRGAQAVITGNVGPNAFGVLRSAGVPVYVRVGGTVAEALEAYKAGTLEPMGSATAASHSGTRSGRGGGRGARRL